MKEHHDHHLWWKYLLGCIIIAGAIFTGQIIQRLDWNWLANLDLDFYECLAIMTGLFLFKALTMVVLPSAVIYLVSGLLFPVDVALMVVVAGITGEFILNYYMGRTFGRRQVQKIIQYGTDHSERFSQLTDKQLQNNPLTIFLLRFLPGPPNNITSLLFGSSDSPFVMYLWSSLLGAIPKAITLTLAGTAIMDPFSWQFLLPTGIFGVLVIIVMLWHHYRPAPVEEPESKEIHQIP
ncbi:MAG: VTT domain-containing protein [Clostridiaceae bacterium]|nr:VTT domain-containing protein [Clostridiaceae bacterium]